MGVLLSYCLIDNIFSSNHRNEHISGIFSSVISDHQMYFTSILSKYTQFKRHSKFITKQSSYNLDLFSRYFEDSLNNATFNKKHDADPNDNYSILKSALSHSHKLAFTKKVRTIKITYYKRQEKRISICLLRIKIISLKLYYLLSQIACTALHTINTYFESISIQNEVLRFQIVIISLLLLLMI